MRELAADLLSLLASKGSSFEGFLTPGLIAEEVQEWEDNARFPFPQEVRDFLMIFGGGVTKGKGGARTEENQLVPDFVLLKYQIAAAIASRYDGSGIFGEKLLTKGRVGVCPMMTNGVDYISVLWDSKNYCVIWKTNSFGYASWQWGSIREFILSVAECWREGAIWLDAETSSLRWDIGQCVGIFRKFGMTDIGSSSP